jgi:hypothetical protein
MEAAVLKEIESLRRLSVGGLRLKYREVFGEDSRSHHKDFLFRRIAWRLQAVAEGDLSERARRRAQEIANDADLRIRAALQLEILALRHELGVLQRSAKRPKLTTADRLQWVWLTAVWKDWRSEVFLVSTPTVLGRHRWGFGLFSTWKTRRGQRGYQPRGRKFELDSLLESQLAALLLKLITTAVSVT